MKKLFAVSIALIALGWLAGCAGDGASGQSEIGRRIYNSGGASSVPCVTCHTLDGTTLVGPSFKGYKDVAGTRVPGLSAEEYTRQSIVDPEAHVVEGYNNQMYRSYGDVLTEEEIDGLVAFLLSQ